MIIYKTIYEIETLLNINDATLMEMSRNLKEVKKSLDAGIELLSRFKIDLDKETKEELRNIAIQLTYVNKNIETLNVVLLMKEGQVFEHITQLEKLNRHMVCLN